jgi:hypothetical protein
MLNGIGIIISRRIICSGGVARMEIMRNAHKSLVGNLNQQPYLHVSGKGNNGS